jgi:deoxyribodipyrimidine photo-lyase
MTRSPDRPAIVWFRRDLRVHDHPALTAALAAHPSIVPIFILDEALLGGRWPAPARVDFMVGSVRALGAAIAERGGSLVVRRGRPAEVVARLARELGAHDVYVSRDHAPYGRRRDRAVAEALAAVGAELHAKRGNLVHEPDAIATGEGRPYTVYSPFRRAWERLEPRAVLPVPDRIPAPATLADGSPLDPGRLPELDDLGLPALASTGVDPALPPAPGEAAARARLDRWVASRDEGLDGYAARRDLLGTDGTSRLSADLRWGTLSPTEVLLRTARDGDGPRVYANELVWREFYAHVLWHEPRVARESFVRAFDDLPWRDDPVGVDAWRAGRTGVPVVDAAMRQLRASGWMHNRARMIAASFLTKDLLVDWRVGERHFMAHLLDGDLASNNGGWQWTASTGTDPQPYFRIFNPVSQGRRFDPDGTYVRRWVPELAGVPLERLHEPWTMTASEQVAAGVRIGVDYPAPIVGHAEARDRALAVYAATRDRARAG